MRFYSSNSLKGLPTFNIAKAFNYLFDLRALNNSIKEKIKREITDTRECIKSLVFSTHCMHHKISDNGKILFLLTPSNISQRKDIKNFFFQVAETAKSNYDIVYWDTKKVINFYRTLQLSYLCLSWAIILRKEKYKLSQILAILPKLIEIKDKTDALQQTTKIDKYKLCVLFYDANCIDNYFSQLFQNLNIETATLQHGVMIAKRKEVKNNPDFCGIEFRNFISTHFLVWNNFTKREAIKSGIPEYKIKVLGVAKCINNTPIFNANNKTIGLVLDGEFEKENNDNLIKIASTFAEKYNYKIILRFHPRMDSSIYNHCIDKNIFSICPKNTSLRDFIAQTEFCIVANSTVFIEMICWHTKVYRYSSRNNKDKFRDLKYPSFHTLTELESLYKTGIENIPIEIDEIMGNINPQEKYNAFFKNYIG